MREEYSAQASLCALLSYELFDVPLHLTSVGGVLEEAQRHSVTPLIYPAVKGTRRAAGILRQEEELLFAVRRTALYSVRRFESVLNCQTELLALLEDIPCAVLKGMSVACIYPHSELRTAGDIDLLVREADLKRASVILSEHGYTYTHATDLHTCFIKCELCI